MPRVDVNNLELLTVCGSVNFFLPRLRLSSKDVVSQCLEFEVLGDDSVDVSVHEDSVDRILMYMRVL